ncbi:MAG: patatin-like phospholipase family protein [Piscinibacter sp.]|nr:patatin-like phospholipase family protein [Piscinibacter sp.]
MVSRSRIGVALAGGGPLGAIYELGALCALDEAIDGLDLADCHAYVGVSAGGFIAAALANGMSPREQCASFIENEGAAHDIFEPSLLVRPAWGEFARRLASLPRVAAQALWVGALQRRSASVTLEHLARALPTGLFSNTGVEAQLRRQFARPGRSNDFRELRRKLVLVATDLDSGESAPFGQTGWDAVPISQAVQASSALPGLFPPVEIGGRFYVDGALKKTLHASVLLDEGVDLLLCLNPLVPFDSTHSPRHRVLSSGEPRIPRLVDGGLPVVLSQTFRTLIHSRLELGMKGYERSHPGTDILLFEPDHRDAEMFLANTFGYSQRRWLAEHAYRLTREQLRAQRPALSAKLARHGLALNDAVLDDHHRSLLRKQARRPAQRLPSAVAVKRLEQVLDELEAALAPA